MTRRGSCLPENGSRRSAARISGVTNPHDHHWASDARSESLQFPPLERLGSAKTKPITDHVRSASRLRPIQVFSNPSVSFDFKFCS